MPTSEGWPKGFWEALLVLKRRGILLAIISKNEESRVVEAWDTLVARQLKLDDFAICRINWRPKPENMAEILAHVNLLPGNVIYIDDNPAERAAMKGAFPDIRVLGGTPLTWRRILLWSSETQVQTITAESAARTEMVRAQVLREEQRATVSSEEFLASLNVRMTLFQIVDADHPRFPRVFELINKTNQFNTTGKRWTREECVAAFASRVAFYAFEVADHYTEYGLVGVLIVDAAGIRQFVMSCRIMGLEAEVAAVAQIGVLLREGGATTMVAAMVETDRNQPCRDLYSRCGFEATEGGWTRALEPWFEVPAHIALTVERTRSVPPRVPAFAG
jgi:FkbH-like protein